MKYNRYDQILKLIVEDFIETASPVGSEALISKHNLDVSSATIRNVMAKLEEEGYLEKTHTSSGRVPSKKGYEYYLENLYYDDSKECLSLEEELENHFRVALQQKNKSIEDVMQQSCQVLSEITNLATLVLGPNAGCEKLVSLQVVKVNEETITAILITDQGYVENKTFLVPPNINIGNIQECVRLLNERLVGTTIDQIVDKLNVIAPLLTTKLGREANIVLSALKEAISRFAKARLSSYGTKNLLELPEYSENKERYKEMMDYLDDKESIINMMFNSDEDDELKLNINLPKSDSSADIAVVSKGVKMPYEHNAKIAVVGPKRMDYKKVTKALEIISKILDEYFTEGD